MDKDSQDFDEYEIYRMRDKFLTLDSDNFRIPLNDAAGKMINFPWMDCASIIIIHGIIFHLRYTFSKIALVAYSIHYLHAF